VLLSGSGQSDQADGVASMKILEMIESSPDHFLALDAKGKIRHEYELKTKSMDFARKWLARVLSQKSKQIAWSDLPKDKKKVFFLNDKNSHKIHKEDQMWVTTSANSSSKTFITSDKTTFSEKVVNDLKKHLGVVVVLPENSL